MNRVIRNKLVFAMLFVVLSVIELGQFSYAPKGEKEQGVSKGVSAQLPVHAQSVK